MIKRHMIIVYNTLLFICVGMVLLTSVVYAASDKKGADRTPSLPDELTGFSIQDSFTPLDARPIGTVQSVKGKLVVRHGRKFSAYYAVPGDRLYEHDILYTLGGSRCRVIFVTADVITIGGNSRISIDQLADDRRSRKKRSVFSILRGKAMFYVLRLFRYKFVNTEVHTPTAIAGVRGTKFGVKVELIDDKRISAGPVYLADASGYLLPGLLAQKSLDERVQTTVYGFDGVVAVTSTVDGTTRTVAAGQNVMVGPVVTGQVIPTPPNEAKQFAADTDAPPPGDDPGTQETGGSGIDGGDDDSGDDDSESGDSTDATGSAAGTAVTVTTNEADVPDVNQALTSQTVIEEAADVVSGMRVGYFSALLTRFEPSPALADIYTNSSRVDIDASKVSGKSIVIDTGFITATGTGIDDSRPYISQIKSDASTPPVDTGDLGTSAQMDDLGDDSLGSNNYMEWGFWKMSTLVQDKSGSGPVFAVSDRAYYIGGQVTPDAAVNGISGTYSGQAWGTFFDGNGGILMNGTFDCEVNGLAKTVSHFDLHVLGGGSSASINGSGVFNGSSGEFKIDAATYQLSGANAANKSCHGSLYGPNGQHIGGAWAMDKGAGNEAAVGIFVGDKQ